MTERIIDFVMLLQKCDNIICIMQNVCVCDIDRNYNVKAEPEVETDGIGM